MISVSQLQSLNPAAWTALFEKSPETHDIVVTGVEAEGLGRRQHLVRYLLSMAGYWEPATCIGKKTNAAEAHFYRELAPQLGPIAPRCWFHSVMGQKGWIVIDEVHDDRPAPSWNHGDIEAILDALATLHATFWDRASYLDSLGWLPDHGARRRRTGKAAIRRSAWMAEWRAPMAPQGWDAGAPISEHALRVAGRLGPLLVQAATGLTLVARLGGDMRLLDADDQQVLAEILDDPLPMLERLRELPVTLVHGNPAPHHWRISLFREHKLLDWQDVSIGPSVSDLVAFLERADLAPGEDGGWRPRPDFPDSEETIVDGYLLGMSHRLGRRFNARLVRQAIPAARCLYGLTFWLPRLADWLSQAPVVRWADDAPITSTALEGAGLGHLVALRPHLTGVFARLLAAARSL
jgi:hypothetical protein